MLFTFCSLVLLSFYFFKDFIYLFETWQERENEWRGVGTAGEAGSPLSREPNMGLDPRTLEIMH